MHSPNRAALGSILGLLLLAIAARAQETATGPIKPPVRKESPAPAANLNTSTPSIPVEEIIRRFAAREAEFRAARESYTFTQTVRVQEFDARSGRPGGEFRRTSDVVFTPDGGKRFEKITYEPPSSMEMATLTREDMQDIENIQPFVLTTEDLPKYDLEYLGRQRVDEIGTYVFSVAPKRIEKGQRYFEGKIWVEEDDLQIVKTYGKAVPDLRQGKSENLFPKFETYREQIDGKYWFPTYTHADDVLHFTDNSVRIKMTVRYSNYKRFAVSTRILSAEPVKPEGTKPPKPPL